MKAGSIPRSAAAIAFGVVLASPAAAQAPALTDSQIVAIYAQVNSFDIETALLAERKGCTDQVRSLAHHIGADHLAVRKAILELAAAQGIGYDLPPARVEAQRGHDAVMARLSTLKCDAFDAAFLEHDVAFHTAAIEAVRTILLPNTKNPELKKHFTAIVPAFEGHLASTKAVKAGKPLPKHHDKP